MNFDSALYHSIHQFAIKIICVVGHIKNLLNTYVLKHYINYIDRCFIYKM